ncbi:MULTISPECIES: FitA-like ribbon-helix-helix domain-containing protein [unclassified Isoptericola]|uniref:FitA-like ribbon-helix-helix domain-containing protein n=1 Tax=Isoptericola sp. NPDC057191 TaxID=3346041 RepID=UPI00363C9750
MEQVLIRSLPDGTKASLRARAERNHRSVEAEARAILSAALSEQPASLVELLADRRPEADFDWDPPATRVGVREVDF